ncbi:MAG: hypothetical protein RSA20_07780, partial [Oscillospiraceae bacterium]
STSDIFQNSYMPFAIKWGKFSSVIAMLIVFLPAFALMIFFGARPDKAAIISGIVGMLSAFCAWYIVDPITLFPILGTPGMYITYVSGNSKEIRAPAALQAMDAADVKGGTPEGTIISAIAIATSTFVSLAVMTLVAVFGNYLLQILPDAVTTSLKYLLPSLFGALAMQRVVLNPKVAAVGIPLAFITFFMKKAGMFKFLPFGGGYTSLLICVFVCMFVSKLIFAKEHPELAKKKGE